MTHEEIILNLANAIGQALESSAEFAAACAHLSAGGFQNQLGITIHLKTDGMQQNGDARIELEAGPEVAVNDDDFLRSMRIVPDLNPGSETRWR